MPLFAHYIVAGGSSSIDIVLVFTCYDSNRHQSLSIKGLSTSWGLWLMVRIAGALFRLDDPGQGKA